MCAASADLLGAIKELMAGQLASNSALLGAMKSGFQAREKAGTEPAFNWLLTHTGKDVAAFLRECIMGDFAESEERDVVLSLVAAVTKFLVRSDKDKDRKVQC